MKFDAWKLLDRAVEEGLQYGITRLFKHATKPMTEAQMRAQLDLLHQAIMQEIGEILDDDQ